MKRVNLESQPARSRAVSDNQKMSQKQQKDRERFFAENFVNQLSLPKGELIDHEEPDFLYVCTNDRKIGIEVTELRNFKTKNQKYSPSQRQGTIDKIIKNAERVFRQDKGENLNLSFRFIQNLSIDNKRALILQKEIVDIIKKTVQGNSFEKGFDIEVNYPLPKELISISGFFHPLSDVSIWYSGEGKWMPNAKASEINEVLHKKSSKLKSYKNKCDEIFLLIVEGIPPNSMFDSFNEALTESYTTSFDRVYIYRNMIQKVLKLKLNH